MNKKVQCNFHKKFNLPQEDYILFSYSIFYTPHYLRHYYRKDSKNIAVQRQFEFITNIIHNLNNIEAGFVPDHWYIRIYYDASIFRFTYKGKKPWVIFFKQYNKHPRLQFVEFHCPDFMVNKHFHLNLFGTITRLHPLFEKDNQAKMIVLCDADDIWTKGFIKEITRFEQNEKENFLAFCSRYEISFYKQETGGDCFMRMSMVATKVKLDPLYWDFILYQVKYFQDPKFVSILDQLQTQWSSVFPNKPIRSYREFEYGMDEIILNYYVEKLYEKNNIDLVKIRYQPNTSAIFSTLVAYLRLNYRSPEKKKDVERLMKKFLGNDYNPEHMEDNFEAMTFKVKQKIGKEFKQNYNDIMQVVLPIREEIKLLHQLTIPQTLLNYFLNVSRNDYDVPPYKYYFTSLKPWIINMTSNDFK